MSRPFTVELAQFRNREFAGWQEFGPFASKREAWDFIKAQGFSDAGKGLDWLAYPAGAQA